MQRINLFRGRTRANHSDRRRVVTISALALAMGAAAFGVVRGRQGKFMQRILKPFRSRIPG